MCISSRNQINNGEECLCKLLSINTDEYSKLSEEVFPNDSLSDNCKNYISNLSTK